MRMSLYFIVALLVFVQCRKASDPSPATTTPKDTMFAMSYDVTALKISTAFNHAMRVGSVEDLSLDEISGIGCSRVTPHSFWAEEDSGNENKIYLLDSSGVTLATFRMTSISDRDWEDLSVAPGPVEGKSYIYLAETGDNNFVYPTKYIYRFAEPDLAGSQFPVNGEIAAVDVIALQYPDGIKNAEAVMVDPLTRDIFIISKEDQAVVYWLPYPQSTSKVNTMVKLGTLPFSTVTAADISPDGTEILIKNYTDILYWKKTGNESISKTLQSVPSKVSYTPELKGESVCWLPDGSGYFTASENKGQSTTSPIYYYSRKK